jgi:hypothetical protein
MGPTRGLITENVGQCKNSSKNGLRKFLNPSMHSSGSYAKLVEQ